MAPPTACNRSAGPAVEPVPVRPRHVVDAFGSVSYPRIPLRRPAILSFGGGSPSLSTRMRRPPRAQRERGYPRRLPGSPGRGLCLFAGLPAHHAEGPQPPHELGGGGGVRLRLGHVLASIYFSPFSPTYFRQSRQRGCAGFANADAPLSASRRPPPSRPHRRWIRPSGGMTVPLS